MVLKTLHETVQKIYYWYWHFYCLKRVTSLRIDRRENYGSVDVVTACRPAAELASFWNKPLVTWVATHLPDYTWVIAELRGWPWTFLVSCYTHLVTSPGWLLTQSSMTRRFTRRSDERSDLSTKWGHFWSRSFSNTTGAKSFFFRPTFLFGSRHQ